MSTHPRGPHCGPVCPGAVSESGAVSPTIFKVTCPCGSGTAVEARLAGFSSTSVQVTACRPCVARSIVGYEVRTSWAYANAIPTSTTGAHRDGLVSFG